MKKTKTVCVFILALLATVVSLLAYLGHNRTEQAISFLDQQMWDKYPQIMHEPIKDDYPLSLFLKDTIITVGMYKDIMLVLMSGVLLTILCLFIACLKKVSKP